MGNCVKSRSPPLPDTVPLTPLDKMVQDMWKGQYKTASELFASYDANKDDKLTAEEVEKFRSAFMIAESAYMDGEMSKLQEKVDFLSSKDVRSTKEQKEQMKEWVKGIEAAGKGIKRERALMEKQGKAFFETEGGGVVGKPAFEKGLQKQLDGATEFKKKVAEKAAELETMDDKLEASPKKEKA